MHDNTGIPWQDHYEGSLCSAEEAAATIQSGDHIWVPTGHSSPAIMEAIAPRTGEVHNVEIRGLAVPSPGLFTLAAAESFHYQDQFRESAHPRCSRLKGYRLSPVLARRRP